MLLEIPSVSLWAYFGTFYLGWLTYQDYTQNMSVDDRKNYFMLGLSLALLSHFSRSIWYILSITILGFFFRYMYKKYFESAIGEGDVSALSWIFLGLAIVNPFSLLFFIILFGVLTGMYLFLKLRVFKYSKPLPFFGVILLSFIVNNALWAFYW